MIQALLRDKLVLLRVFWRLIVNKKVNNKASKNQELSWQEKLSQKTGRPLPIPLPKENDYSLSQVNIDNSNVAPASIIKEEFNNPYTFIPFLKNGTKRDKPTLLTVEEQAGQEKRITGILDLEVRTISPLLTNFPEPSKIILNDKEYFPPFSSEQKKEGHKVYEALAIENDIIVPASSIRGALRTLMTIIVGGTLGNIDDNLWLCQGRDKPLGPVENSNKLPNYPLLAEVDKPGNSNSAGTIRLGETKLIPTKIIENLFNNFHINYFDSLPTKEKKPYFWIDNPECPTSLSTIPDPTHTWKLKLSGKKVNESPKFTVKDKDKNITIDSDTVNNLMKKNNITYHKDLFIDDPCTPISIAIFKNDTFKWKLKWNDKFKNYEIQGDGINHEGCFLVTKPEKTIELNSKFWWEYQNRYRYRVGQELKNGDLIWLEPKNVGCNEIKSEADIKSIQWARWGREGISIKEVLSLHHKHVLPDSLNTDGKVDMVTDLFGQIPLEKNAAGPFAARIRPHNLIFQNVKENIYKDVILAPLSSPHPGCLAFYRAGESSSINKNSPLKGYKVYRNSNECNESGPWHYNNQGIYDENGILNNGIEQSVNKTVDLLKENQSGRLRIAFRSLTKAELALLLMACSVDWKICGGKPLGLGHCRVTKIRLRDEEGLDIIPPLIRQSDDRMKLPEEYEKLIIPFTERLKQYHASQKPVEKLRYPRAVVNNNFQNSRGGHIWFGRHAVPKKAEGKNGFENLWAKGELQNKINGKKNILAQPLPAFEMNNLKADLLYGYDCIGDKNGHTLERLDRFDPENDQHTVGRSSGNTSQNSKTRQANRDARKADNKESSNQN
jgi:CRISPR-associated protein (TIGR03986 family)